MRSSTRRRSATRDLAVKLLACLFLLTYLWACGSQAGPSIDETVLDVELSGFGDQVASQIHQQQQAVRQASTAQPEARCQALGELGQLYHAYDLPAAAKAYAEAARCSPMDAKWPYLRGRLLASSGDLGAALGELQHAAELAPDASAIRLALGDVALDADRLELAKTAFESVVARHPRQAAALLGLGRVHLTREDLAAARPLLEEALELSPQAHIVHHHLARLSRLEGDWEAARHHAAQAGSRLPGVQDPWMEGVQARRIGAHNLLQSAQRALLDGRVEEARATYRAALQMDPQSVDGWINWGGIEAQLGNDAVARNAFQQAQALDDQRPRIHFNLGVLDLREARWEAAEAGFRRTLDLDPGFAEGRLHLALALRGGGEFEDAEATIRQAAGLDDAMAHVWLARWRMEDGRYREALGWLEQGAEVASDPRLFHALARFLATCPRAELRDGQRAADLLPRQAGSRLADWELLRTGAMVDAELGNYEAAVQSQSGALASAPQTPGLRRLLEDELQGYRAGKPVRLHSWKAVTAAAGAVDSR